MNDKKIIWHNSDEILKVALDEAMILEETLHL